MNPFCKRNQLVALTLPELVIVLAALAIFAMILLPSLARPKGPTLSGRCRNNLREVGLSFRVWAIDHNDKFPMQVSVTNGGTMEFVDRGTSSMHFLSLSNELSTPKVLFCPSDSRPGPPTNFIYDFDSSKISYFVGVGAAQGNAMMILTGDRNITNGPGMRGGFLELLPHQPAGWTHEMHAQHGNIGLTDGSVQLLSTPQLRKAITTAGVATNRLAMP